MNNDFNGNSFPPPRFQPEGPVELGKEAPIPIVIDPAPTQGSGNAVSSNGVHQALQDFEPIINPQSGEDNTDYVYIGNKTWRNLRNWIGHLIDNAIQQGLTTITWDTVSGFPDFITEEADPTVPAHVKSITEAQKEALAWFSSNFSRENLTPGHVVIIGEDGDSLQIMPLGELLTPFFPALSAVLSGIVAPITSLSVVQQVNDIKVTWTDITRKAGYYQVAIRHQIQNGDWSAYLPLNKLDFSVKEYLWKHIDIPTGITRVGVRVRYLDKEDVASEWKVAETTFDSHAPVITETVYERVSFSGRWWSQGSVVEETQYERVLYSGRWWNQTTQEPGENLPSTPTPLIVKRWEPDKIEIILPLVAPHNNQILYELNYRVVGTSTWYYYVLNSGMGTAPANPRLFSVYVGETQTSISITHDTEPFFTTGMIEVRARAILDEVSSAWSAIAQEKPGSSSGGDEGDIPPIASSYILHYYMSQANGFLDLVVEKGEDGLPYLSDNGGDFGKPKTKYQVMGADVLSSSQPFSLQDYLVPLNTIFSVKKRGCNDFETWWSESNGNYEHQVFIWIEPIYS